MPFEYRIDIDAGRATVSASGILDSAEVEEIVNRVLDDPHWRPGLDVVIDYTEATLLQLDGVDIHHIADLSGQRANDFGPARIGVVAPLDHIFGMARMYQALCSEWTKTIEVFRDRRSLQAWLGGGGGSGGGQWERGGADPGQ